MTPNIILAMFFVAAILIVIIDSLLLYKKYKILKRDLEELTEYIDARLEKEKEGEIDDI